MSGKNHRGHNKRPREDASDKADNVNAAETEKNNAFDGANNDENVAVSDAGGAEKDLSIRTPGKNRNKKNNSNNGGKNLRNNKNNRDARDNRNRKKNEFGERTVRKTELNELKKSEQHNNKFRGTDRNQNLPKGNNSSETTEAARPPRQYGTENFRQKNRQKSGAAAKESAEPVENGVTNASSYSAGGVDGDGNTGEVENVKDADNNSEKVEIVGIRHRPVGKIYFFAPNDMTYELNEKVVVETARGIELGYVVIKNRLVDISKIVQPLKMIHRKATEEDIARVERNKKLAAQAMKIGEERVKEHGLKLKLIEAEYTFDNSKLIYCFTADNRIDFRDLVRDLAAIFKVRIELRQIGIRDQTKIVGGLSICGRPFCCNSFLQDFEQVTIKMAKEQNISINSTKISGACGRLMCCLRYEHETYESLYKDMPKVNSIVETAAGETGTIVECNVLSGTCKVKISSKTENLNVIKSYPKKELKIIGFIKGERENGE